MLNHLGVPLLLVVFFNISFAALLPNGNFEMGPSPFQLSGTKVMGTDAIPKWKSSGLVEYIKTGTKQGDMLLVVPEGKYAVRLGSDAAISQRVETQKGRFYALTFSFARTCAQEEQLNVSVSMNGKLSDSGMLPLQTMYSSAGFDSYAWGFKAQADQIEITLHNVGVVGEGTSCGPLIDTVAINILDPPRLTGGNLVKNGDFGEGPYVFHDSTWGVLIPPNIEDTHSPLPAWMVESLKAVKFIDSLHFSVPEGQRAVELLAGKESALGQRIMTVPGATYVLTFLVGDANNGCVGPLAVEAFADMASIRVTYDSKGKGGFVKGQLLFKAKSAKTQIRFLSSFYTMKVDGSLCGPVIDDVKVVLRFKRHVL